MVAQFISDYELPWQVVLSMCVRSVYWCISKPHTCIISKIVLTGYHYGIYTFDISHEYCCMPLGTSLMEWVKILLLKFFYFLNSHRLPSIHAFTKLQTVKSMGINYVDFYQPVSRFPIVSPLVWRIFIKPIIHMHKNVRWSTILLENLRFSVVSYVQKL